MNDFEANFTLQLFHISDQEANTTSVTLAPNLSAIHNTLEAQDIDGDGEAGYEHTLFLSSGDAWIPGLFYDASEQIYGIPGAADILIQNELGIQAISFGNHEFDNGTEIIGQLISGEGFETPEGGLPFDGADFPYLSGNIDFSADPNLAPLVVENGQSVADIPQGIAEWAVVVTEGGERIGIVSSTTPAIDDGLTSPGPDVVVTPDGLGVPSDAAGYDALAASIQADVDALLAANPDIDKVILLSHQQVLSVEQELAPRLTGVDIIVAGGSNSVLLDENDPGFDGEVADGPYPGFFTAADGNPILVVNTDAAYQYLGRLVIDFDENGVIIPESYDPDLSGAFETSDEGVARLGAEGNADPEIVAITDLVEETIVAGESNFFAVTSEFLNAERSGGGTDGVRNQETNLGNLTADANLFYAQQFDETVVISFKNGGGIRANIGTIVVPGGDSPPVRLPPEGVEGAKPEGGISQNDVADVLAFNNGLTLLSLTPAQIVAVLESTVANYTGLEASAGDWGQFSGLRFSFDPNQEPGNRIVNAVIVDETDGSVIAVLAQDGVVSTSEETFRIVTLNFLANGGNPGLPVTNPDEEGFDPEIAAATNRVDLVDLDMFPEGVVSEGDFAEPGSEQDAFADYLLANFGNQEGDPTVDLVDTIPVIDVRIQNLDFRDDTVLDNPLVGIDARTEVSLAGDDAVTATDVALDAKLDEVVFVPIEGGFQATGDAGTVDLLGLETLTFVGGNGVFASRSENAVDIELYYQLAFDRGNDTAGATYWNSRVELGIIDTGTVADAFVASPEFASVNGTDLDNAAFVDALIENGGIADVLDEGTRDTLVAGLDDGTLDRGDVLDDLAQNEAVVALIGNAVDDGILLFV